MALLAEDDLRKLLPSVGDVLTKVPVSGKYLRICSGKPRQGVVTAVNVPNRWYRLRFDSGYSEVFYLPDIDNLPVPLPQPMRKVICVETGKQYDSIREASQATNCLASSICNVCKGRVSATRGLHWKYVEE